VKIVHEISEKASEDAGFIDILGADLLWN